MIDVGSICRRKTGETQIQYRLLGFATMEYSEENGNEPEDVCVLEPVLSGFAIAEQEAVAEADPDKLRYLIVTPAEFDDIFIEAEEGGARYGRS